MYNPFLESLGQHKAGLQKGKTDILIKLGHLLLFMTKKHNFIQQNIDYLMICNVCTAHLIVVKKQFFCKLIYRHVLIFQPTGTNMTPLKNWERQTLPERPS